MPVPKGTRIGGRKKGTPNKITADVRGMVLSSLTKVGGEKYLIAQAKENPTAYLTLVGKCLPKEITGADGGAIQHALKVTWGP